jgi:hypothetical protein
MVFLEQLRSRDVARHQVWRELHAREAQVQRLRHRLHQERFRESRHAYEQDVAAGEQRRDQVVHNLVLSNDPSPNLLDQRRARARQLLEKLNVT